MLKNLTRFTTLLCAVFLFCFLLSPTALAAGGNYGGNRGNYVSYEGVRNNVLQNVGSCQNNSYQGSVNGNQAREYKLYEASPIPSSATNCNRTSTGSKPTSCANSATGVNGASCANGTSCVNGIYCSDKASCSNRTACKQNSSCANTGSQQNASCTAVAKAQTNTPAQSTASGSQSNVAVSAYAEEVVRLVNAERAKNNLPALTLDKSLTAAAQVRAQEATVKFSHTRPNGSSCFSVLSSMGISYRRAGENIAIGQSSPSQVVKAWMESPGHRANILGDYTKIGVGVQQAGSSFSGYSWAQFFTK